MPPDDGRPIDDVVFDTGCCNSVGGRTDFLVADLDGTNAGVVDWPFADGPFTIPTFAELDGRLFALTDADGGGDLRLWVTDDLDTWEQLSLPPGIDQRDTWSQLVGDGERMVLTTRGPFGPRLVEVNQPIWITADGTTWTAWESALLGHPTRGIDAADFGWMDFHDDTGDPEAPVNVSPALAASPDAETWQVVPIPIPVALADRGLTWADTRQVDGEPYDVTLGWGWEAYAHGDTIFIAFGSDGSDGPRELWVGRVASG